MKFVLNWKGTVVVFVAMFLLLAVLFTIQVLKKEQAKEVQNTREKGEGSIAGADQREISEETLQEEKAKVLKAARKDFKDLKGKEAEQEDLKKVVENVRKRQ